MDAFEKETSKPTTYEKPANAWGNHGNHGTMAWPPWYIMPCHNQRHAWRRLAVSGRKVAFHIKWPCRETTEQTYIIIQLPRWTTTYLTTLTTCFEIQHELFGKVHFAAKYKIKCSFFRKISYLTVCIYVYFFNLTRSNNILGLTWNKKAFENTSFSKYSLRRLLWICISAYK